MSTKNESESSSDLSARIESELSDSFENAIFHVGDGHVWVSGMNSHCKTLADTMAYHLAAQGIPAGLVRDDNADFNGGVLFSVDGL